MWDARRYVWGEIQRKTRRADALTRRHDANQFARKVLVAKIDRSPGNFDTAPDVLKQLKAAGVHDSVILAMVRA